MAVPGQREGAKRRRERTGREGCWHLQPGHLLKGRPERDAPARYKTDREREREREKERERVKQSPAP